MDIFLLGAGRPALGRKPSALKDIALNTKAMDWQIHSFESVASIENIHYLGGYHVEKVIETYPKLNFTVIPDWREKSVLDTLLRAPFSNSAAITSYSDTIFRKSSIDKLLISDADVSYGVDEKWKERYQSRTQDDINAAETVSSSLSKIKTIDAEFTGLIHFNEKVISYLKTINADDVGSNLLDLLTHLKDANFTVQSIDISGGWAEFNSPNDIAKFILGTKAETLARLEPRVKLSTIGTQVSFTIADWNDKPNEILSRIKLLFSGSQLVVRSSSKGEDNWVSSNAGGFESLLNIDSDNHQQLTESISTVIGSYGDSKKNADQVLVQELLTSVKLSGVVFTCELESGAPYYTFNFDDTTESTESVTAGTSSDLRTVIVSRLDTQHLNLVAPELTPVLDAIEELEQLLGYNKLDIEFAVCKNGEVHIFQVRPITVDHSKYELDPTSVKSALTNSVSLFKKNQKAPSHIHANQNIFANMPDWNPAEIIGTRPKPLAFSLYRELITNDIWAKQRAEYGYLDVRPSPLLYSFSGQPYVDVRASINSFIPASLSGNTIGRLTNAYLEILKANPHFHDKLEFEVVFTIWTPNFNKEAVARLLPHGVSNEDINSLESSLKVLTLNALTRLSKDIASVAELEQRRADICGSESSIDSKIMCLLSDCKEFGTLAFSHAARAGFVATTLLNSLKDDGFISSDRRSEFLISFNTVAGEFTQDKASYEAGLLSRDKLVEEYGHLRPGTYELSTQAYWEDQEKYLTQTSEVPPHASFSFDFSEQEQLGLSNILSGLGSTLTVASFQNFIEEAIKAREFVKFEFTKNLSRALDLCVQLGEENGIERDDMSFIEYQDIHNVSLNLIDWNEIKALISSRKSKHRITSSIQLPSVISNEQQFYAFERFSSQPNFVTTKSVQALIDSLDSSDVSQLSGKVVLIPQADPGYDWLFGHDISGLITKYGGANSHMAIRAAEIGLPAAIGVGEKLYDEISHMNRIELDCANQIIREVQ